MGFFYLIKQYDRICRQLPAYRGDTAQRLPAATCAQRTGGGRDVRPRASRYRDKALLRAIEVLESVREEGQDKAEWNMRMAYGYQSVSYTHLDVYKRQVSRL